MKEMGRVENGREKERERERELEVKSECWHCELPLREVSDDRPGR